MIKIKKIVAVFLAVIFVANIFIFSTPKQAQALIPVHDTLGYILSGLKYAAQHVGLLSSGLPGSGAAASATLIAAETGCSIPEDAARLAMTADNIGGVAAIAGDAAQISKLSVKIATLTAISTCYNVVLKGAKIGSVGGSVAGGEQVITVLGFTMAELRGVINAYDQRIENLVAQRDEAIKKMWEGVAYRILVTVQQQVTTKLINQLISKYKIGNYLKYADAVATQVYTANFVQKNFPEKADQLIIRSILSNDATQYGLMPILKEQANKALGFLPEQLDFADPDYYVKMAMAGTGAANPYYLQSVYQVQAGMTASQATEMAKQEIAQGQGFIPARNCSGVIAQQNSILDKQRQKIGSDISVKNRALGNLQSQAALNPGSVKPEDIQKAVTDLTKANYDYQNVGGNASVFAEACADIKNPAAAISNFANSYLASALNVVNSPKPGSLPFFANFVEGVATNFLMNIVSGGTPSTELLKEAGYQAANIAANEILVGTTEAKTLKDADAAAQKSNLTFSATKSSVAGEYTVTWNVSAINGASRITITGTSLNFSSLQTSGSTNIRTNGGLTLNLKIFDSANKLLESASFTIPGNPAVSVNLPQEGTATTVKNIVSTVEDGLNLPPSPPEPTGTGLVCSGSYTSYQACKVDLKDEQACMSLCGAQVNGAATYTPSFQIRGALPTLNLRGIQG
jgi:hypothetical protein